MESKNAKALYHFRPDLYILKPYSALRLANIRDMCYTKVNYNIVWYSEKEGIYEKRSKGNGRVRYYIDSKSIWGKAR